MARARRTFGPLLHGTLVAGVCVASFVGVVWLWLWCTGDPGTPRVNLEAKVAALVPLVTAGEPGSRVAAIQSLGEVLRGFPPSEPYVRALAVLHGAVRDPDATVRSASAEALGGLGPSARPAADELTAALKDDDLDVRLAVARALLKIGGEVQAPALRVLADVVADPDPIPDRRSVIEAMEAAGEPGHSAAAQALASLLANRDGAVRSDAVSCVPALGAGGARILPALGVLLKADDPALRFTAALAVMQARGVDASPDDRVVTILAEGVSNPSLSLTERQSALAAFYSVGPEELGPMVVGSVAFPEGSPVPSALRRCGLELARQLGHKDADVRRAAATLLHMIDIENLAGKDDTEVAGHP